MGVWKQYHPYSQPHGSTSWWTRNDTLCHKQHGRSWNDSIQALGCQNCCLHVTHIAFFARTGVEVCDIRWASSSGRLQGWLIYTAIPLNTCIPIQIADVWFQGSFGNQTLPHLPHRAHCSSCLAEVHFGKGHSGLVGGQSREHVGDRLAHLHFVTWDMMAINIHDYDCDWLRMDYPWTLTMHLL